MKRREFMATASAIGAGAAIGLPGALHAQVKAPEDGVEYYTLRKRAPVDAPAGRIEVVEFFWYNCPHCNAFEPMLQAWARRLPPDVTLRRVPAAFRDEMVPQQRFYYTLEAMGKVDELHSRVFNAIHKERLDLTRGPLIVEWVGKQGLDATKFREIYESFATSAKARRASQLQDAYQVEGVPSLGVAGRWYTDGNLAMPNSRMLQVVDHLIDQARASR